jgi:hypothetical protein
VEKFAAIALVAVGIACTSGVVSTGYISQAFADPARNNSESLVAPSSGAISAVWANNGEDKVTQDELRASSGHNVINSLWDGTTIRLFGAKNEVIDFNLVMEAASASAPNVSVTMTNLLGPHRFVIRYAARPTSNLFNWTTTESELFYVRYLQILGLSQGNYGALDYLQEPTFPERAQCAHGLPAGCAWTKRPVANKFYPDIAVPIELVPQFTIAAQRNQSVWADIFIPRKAASGQYIGSVIISANNVPIRTVPISLWVRNFALPDLPTSKTMLFTSYGDIHTRYGDANTLQAMQEQMLVAHRHKISIIDDNMGVGSQWVGSGWGTDAPAAQWIPFLNGTGFTAANGYAGPGEGTGNNVFSIGTYAGMTAGTTQAAFTANFNGWASWFKANSPSTERFVYLCDETNCQSVTPTLTTQLGWWTSIKGPGAGLHTLATQPLLDILPPGGPSLPLSDITSLWPFSQGYGPNQSIDGSSIVDQTQADIVIAADPRKRLFAYNSSRPGEGSFATEDEGTSLRELAWGQYKKEIDRWFFWEATNYSNQGPTNLFTTAETFGAPPSADPSYGMIGGKNGDGVLFYPGTDNVYPAESYGINGPIASLRLKFWRRGIQDADYLALAQAKNPVAVANLVNKMVPSALWENQCPSPATQCTYFYGPVSWSNNPDNWEAARRQLAHIIDGQ